MILSHRKWCYKTNSWYLPDLSFSFGGCLIVLFDSLLVAVNVLETEGETEREREVKIIQGYLTATVKVPLLFMLPLLKKICSTTCCVLRCDIFFPGFNFSQFSRYITSNQKKKRKKTEDCMRVSESSPTKYSSTNCIIYIIFQKFQISFHIKSKLHQTNGD